MAAATGVVGQRQRPASNVAFGSLLDLARLRRQPADAEVCEACQTINARHAHFCKGCDGKLPAYFAAVEAGAPGLPQPFPRDPDERRSRLAIVVLVALWCTVTAVAALQAHGPRRADPVAFTNLQVAAPEPVDVAVAAERPAALPHAVRQHAAPSAEPSRVPVAVAAVAPAAGADVSDDGPSRKPSAAAARPVRHLAVQHAARCEGRNFFARAVCMNNLCARPEARRSPQCAETVRQARLGEARRNPRLAG